MFLILRTPVCLLFWLCQSEGKCCLQLGLVWIQEWMKFLTTALSTCVLPPGEVLGLLLIPLMTLPSVCWLGVQKGSVVHWSCSVLPDGFPCDSCLTFCTTYFSSIWSGDAFLRESWDPATRKCCLRTTEVLSFVVSFQQCLLPHQSPIIMFQFHVSSSWYVIPSSMMFSDLPQISFCGLSVSLGSSHFPSPSVEPSEGQRFLAQPSCVCILWDVSLQLRNWEGCDAPGSEKRSRFWEHLALSMMNPSSWLL